MSIRRLDEFEMLTKIGEGTYSVVHRARDKATGEIVAVKELKTEMLPDGRKKLGSRLPETEILSSLRHSSIIDLKHVVAGSRVDSLFMVMEYAESDLNSLLSGRKKHFTLGQIKCLMQQFLQGVAYLHRNQVIHRDLKTSNLLLNNSGELKICDFGLARRFVNKWIAHKKVVSLWYRAPELLLGAKHYSTAIDMWSVGCIMAEMLAGEPLFDGTTETDQLEKIIKVLGSPNKGIWADFSKLHGVKKGVNKASMLRYRCSLLRQRFVRVSITGVLVVSDAGFDLLSRLLTYDPRKRISAEEALDHGWFCEVPLLNSKDVMPTFPPNCAKVMRKKV